MLVHVVPASGVGPAGHFRFGDVTAVRENGAFGHSLAAGVPDLILFLATLLGKVLYLLLVCYCVSVGLL